MSKDLDIFTQINHAVLDLQSSDYQTYDRPLKALVKLLQHPSLAAMNSDLKARVDLDAVMARSNATGGGMVGSHKFAWPDDKAEELGVALLLIEKMGEDPSFAISFGHTYYSSSTKLTASIRAIVSQLIIPFVRDYKIFVLNKGHTELKLMRPKSNKIFIVHGHDGEAREMVARFIGIVGFEPVILNEQANQGMTVIEKIVANSDVGFAIVLLTPDDEGRKKGDVTFEPRARQNVLLELGYFIAHLGRPNVCALRRGAVDIPSDFAGVVWESMDAGSNWKQALGKELAAAGYAIDWNLVMR